MSENDNTTPMPTRDGPGRPRIEFNDRMIRQIEVMAGIGMSIPSMAAILDVGDTTLRDRMTNDPLISDALERGRAIAERQVGTCLFQRAIGALDGSNTPNPRDADTGAIRWFEMSRLRRSAKYDSTVPVPTVPLSVRVEYVDVVKKED
jgi:hypothetical protein